MIDIKLLRSDKERFYNSCRARGFDLNILDEFFSLDLKWRENLKILNTYKHDKNIITADISSLVKKGENIDNLKLEVEKINKKISLLEEEQNDIVC
jgi:seryl-tRNA synthetase (EC 6.1.1.11)